MTELTAKYDVHYCGVNDWDTCDHKCAYYYDLDPEDALLASGCLNRADAAEYSKIEGDVESYKKELQEKYDGAIP